jgi:antitoxin component YwqK of YwqJK toxin-antitoxin module
MKFYLIIFFIVLLSHKITGQVNNICNDTNIVKPKSIFLGDMNIHVYDFIKDLPNGKWFYYRTKNCRSTKKKILIEGEFKDYKKNGTFTYYFIKKKRKEKQIQLVIRYLNGELNGGFVIFAENGSKLYEGNYINGKKNGFFIEYDPVKLNNTIIRIDFYIENNLQYCCKYGTNGELTVNDNCK